ncbi:MAG: glycosyltransferase [Actinobacteria bacterium]|nr:glycosyltransferase [Actinomycetota bacterium]
MRIVHIITRLIVGGAQENTILTCRGLRRRGHTVVLLTGPQTGPEGDMFSQAAGYGVKVEVIRSLRRAVHPVHDLFALLEIVAALRRLKPDVVHTHSSKAGILGRLAARLAGVPVVVHTVHGLPFFRYQNGLVNGVYILAERAAAQWADGIVTVADDMIEQACRAKIAPRGKFTTVYSGLEAEAFFRDPVRGYQARERLGIPREAFVLGKVARLAPLKGHKFLLSALDQLMSRHGNLWCLLVGDGVLRTDIEQRLAKSSWGDRVRLTGLIDPCEVPQMLWTMDMLVHTSLHEGLPRAVVQGLLAGVPVVAFDLDGAREVIEQGRTGYLIRPGCVADLVEAVESVVSGTGSVKTASTDVRARLAERFSWQRMVEELERLYCSLSPTRLRGSSS